MRKHLIVPFIFGLFLATLWMGNITMAQWSTNPNINNAICTASSDQYDPISISDGAGGAIITWVDDRNNNDDIYAQRINASGVVQWTADGVAICTATNSQYDPAIISDGAGGAIITWSDYRNGNEDIYAQRISATGVVQWTTDSVAICTATNNQYDPAIITDGAGGAIIIWYDYRNGDGDIYAQRINASGVAQWTADGVGICTEVTSQYNPILTGDGVGGAIIAWQDYRNGSPDIYAQRINATGTVQWTIDGMAICTATNDQYYPVTIADGVGGAIITWQDYRNNNNTDIYAQRIDSAGIVLWTANGVGICTATNTQSDPTLTSDGAGGAIISWYDNRNGNGGDGAIKSRYDYLSSNEDEIYAQRINASGFIQWTTDGIKIGSNVGEDDPFIISDGAGGTIIAWGAYYQNDNDIYAQRVNADGVIQWAEGGMAICTSIDYQENPVIVSDGVGGAIFTWEDSRNGSDDIYAQWVNGSASNFQPAAGQILTIRDVANNQGGDVRMTWQASTNDIRTGSSVQTTFYGIWRKIPPGMTADKVMKAKAPFANDTLGTQYDFIMTIPAVQAHEYHAVTPTLDDSSSTGSHYFKFVITAHTSDPLTYFVSSVDSGYSVDNLAPASVLNLSAVVQAGPAVNLTWDRNTVDPDVASYEIHRSTISGFTPNSSTKIGTTTAVAFTDNAPTAGKLNYYRIVTMDCHDNCSNGSSPASAALKITNDYSMDNKWNMVSLPLAMDNYTKSTLYPTAVSDAFSYANGYHTMTTLSNRQGYWLKFNGAQPVSMTGFLRDCDTIEVSQGWNMVGSISSPVEVSNIVSLTPGLVLSSFFEYANGYSAITTIQPAKGYWVRANVNGRFILSSVVSNQSAVNRITITPSSELPPPPPEEVNNNNSIIPNEYALEQNYPNPFNPTTEINYQLPVDGYVTLIVYNSLGEEVISLVHGMQEAGYKSVTFDASHVASGMYYYRINAQAEGKTFTEIKKMILLK